MAQDEPPDTGGPGLQRRQIPELKDIKFIVRSENVKLGLLDPFRITKYVRSCLCPGIQDRQIKADDPVNKQCCHPEI